MDQVFLLVISLPESLSCALVQDCAFSVDGATEELTCEPAGAVRAVLHGEMAREGRDCEEAAVAVEGGVCVLLVVMVVTPLRRRRRP